MQRARRQPTPEADQFPRSITDLPAARESEILQLSNGEKLDLTIAPVAKRIGSAVVRMLAYNGSIPGPTLRVQQGSEVVVNVANDGDLEATVHWHGLRLENRYDGTHETQEPIPVGGSLASRVIFPDPGVYWYHPHIREDYAQEMGLYGNVLVVPANPEYWPAVNREVLLTLDDILIEDGKVAPFSQSQTTHSAMGRFGNVLLVGGETDLALTGALGQVVRFYLTNTANTRVFNVGLPGARMKLVGGDSGRGEQEEFVEEIILAPSQRSVVDVLFDEPGQLTLEHRTPKRTYALATITVSRDLASPALARHFEALRRDPELTTERQQLGPYLAAKPDKVLAFGAEMDLGGPEPSPGATLAYTCPMHPEIVDNAASRCPKCGMKLIPAELVGEPTSRADLPGGTDHSAETHTHHGHSHEAFGGIEWEDNMIEVNKITTPTNMRWKLIDRTPGAKNAENTQINWRFQVGDRVKIRLLNEMDSDHPMHHPFHIHGAGRFLILSRDGAVEPNLAWTDTILVRTGQTVDILLDVTNPGVWMAHCHIAEHHESGMMFSFNVNPRETTAN